MEAEFPGDLRIPPKNLVQDEFQICFRSEQPLVPPAKIFCTASLAKVTLLQCPMLRCKKLQERLHKWGR